MSEDTSPVIIGDPLPPEEVSLSQQDLDDAVDWWNEVASPLFLDALGE